MIKDYFKIALRYLNKHKGYTLINVSGLAVSIACCILIMLFVRSEFSFDRFHLKSGRIYRAWLEEHYEGQVFIIVSHLRESAGCKYHGACYDAFKRFPNDGTRCITDRFSK